MADRQMRPSRQVDALWWGLLLLGVSFLLGWRALGHRLDDHRVLVAAPFVLITLGVLPALVSRATRRR